VGHVNNGFESRLAQRIDQYDVWKQQFQKNTGRKHCDDGGNPDLWAIKFCKLGDLAADPVPSIAVFGDSHTLAINPYIDALAKKMGRSYIHIALPGCAPLLGVDVSMKYQVGLCPHLARRQLAFVKAHQIKRVLLAARWSLYTDGEYDGPKPNYRLTSADGGDTGEPRPHGAFASGLAATLQAYRALGVEVFVLMQVPQQKVVPEKVYTDIAYMMFLKETQAAEAMSRQASIDLPSHRKLQAYNRTVIERLAKENGVTVLNPDAFFCSGERCLIGDARNSYYRDANHLNTGGASRMAPLLRSLFE
jgi:hypothetical protein